MKASNANKVISVLLSVAMCPMMVPSAAFAADDDAASGASSPSEQTQPADQAEGVDAGASLNNTIAPQSETADASTGEAAPVAKANGEGAQAPTAEEGTEAAVAEVNGKSYFSLQEAIDAASRNATVKLLADTKENVTISTPYVTLDLNGRTLNGGTEKGKPALTVTARVTVMDSSEAQTGTIMREDTAENSGVSSHYVIDIQDAGWLTFESGNVTNNSGTTSGKGASLVRVGDDSIAKYPGLNIKGGTFTQDNFIVIKVDRGDLFLNGGTLNSASSYAIEDWHRATIKGGTVNGAVAAWTYSGGYNSDLTISGGTVNGNVISVNYGSAEGKVAKVSITGGTVNGKLGTYTYNNGLAATTDAAKATIKITGGAFSNDPTKYVVEDSAISKNADGTYGVAKAYLAQVGETSYYTMDEAFKAQTENGGAINLLRDYTTGSTFSSGTVARVVDLNGHTWTCTGTDANSAAFEINYPDASLTVKNGKVVSSQLIGLIPSASGGTITYDNSTLTFEGVEASTTATSGIETNGNNTNDTVVLKNSTLNVPNGFGIYFPSSGTLTIDNSTINAKTMGAQVCSGNLNVTAGSAITVSGDPVEKLEGDGAIQDGAAISIVNRPGYKGLGKIAITGGTFTAKGDNAAIKAYTWDSSTKQESALDNSAKTVAVSGGTFSSAVAFDLCAEGYAPTANADGTYSVGAPVAQIGGKTYASLQAAIDAAQTGDTVQLLADVADCGSITISKNITLEGNGHTISGNSSINVNMPGNADADVTIHNVIFKDIANGNKLSAFYFSQVKGKLTITDCTFDSIEYEAIQVTPAPGAVINISNNMFKAKADGTQVRHIHIEMAYGSGFDYEGENINLTVTDNQLHGTVSGDASMGIWWVGTDSMLKVDGNYMEHPETVSITLTNSGVRYNRGDLIYPARSNANVDVDDLMPVAIVAEQASGESKIHACNTLAEAIAAAKDGETVTLLTDATEDVTISKNITLDLGGKTLTNTNAGKATLTIAKGATATVKNGSIVGGTGYYTIDNYGTATLEDVTATAGNTDSSMIRNDGTLTIESGSYSGGLNVVKSEEDSTLTINGGKFELSYAVSNSYTGVIYAYGTTTITGGEFVCNATTPGWAHPQCVVTGMVEGHPSFTKITGGSFVNKHSRGDIFHGFGKATSDNFEVTGGTFNKKVSDGYFADGYTCVKNADGTYGIATAIAQVGNTRYTSLQAAINATKKGKTIQLLNDTTENVTIAASKQITLDLNGHTLNGGTGTANATILNEGTVTITDTSAGKTGTIKRDDQGIEGETSYYVIKNIGTMVIDQANVVNNSGYKKANSSGSMVGSSLICNGDDDPQASLTINGGTFKQPNFLVVKNGTNGTLTVNGGTLTSNHSAVQNWNKAQILGGSLTGQIWTDAWVEGAIGETIIGGDAQFTGEIVVDITGEVPPTLKIEGGSLDVTSWRVTSAAAAANATVAVSGGTFKAAVPENYCAAGYTPVANADGTYGVKLAEGAYLLQDYRSGEQASWTYPAKEGMAFAGWYKDAAFENPCTASDVEGAAYAKFVPITDLLKYKGRSLRMDKGDPSETTYLRFGYTKAIPAGATYIENGWYYKKLSAPTGDDKRLAAYNNVLNEDGTITSNLVFNNVKASLYTANFTEKAFVKYVTADGTTVEAAEGAYHSSSVSDAAGAILAHPMASEAEKDYATSIKSAIQ